MRTQPRVDTLPFLFSEFNKPRQFKWRVLIWELWQMNAYPQQLSGRFPHIGESWFIKPFFPLPLLLHHFGSLGFSQSSWWKPTTGWKSRPAGSCLPPALEPNLGGFGKIRFEFLALPPHPRPPLQAVSFCLYRAQPLWSPTPAPPSPGAGGGRSPRRGGGCRIPPSPLPPNVGSEQPVAGDGGTRGGPAALAPQRPPEVAPASGDVGNGALGCWRLAWENWWRTARGGTWEAACGVFPSLTGPNIPWNIPNSRYCPPFFFLFLPLPANWKAEILRNTSEQSRMFVLTFKSFSFFLILLKMHFKTV